MNDDANAPTQDELVIAPLGGLGEVGMNCMAIGHGDDLLIVDCGVSFPTSDLGIDVYHPRFDWLEERARRIRGVVLTHGHEDHIGGLPYLLDRFDVPVWGPAYALELAKTRLLEHGFEPRQLDLRPVRPGDEVAVGSLGFEPIRVTHSIAEATALALRTPAGLVVHTGDFKLDPTPPDGETTDEARFAALGREGVDVLLSDSTNVDSEGSSQSEAVVGGALGELVGEARGRVVVGMFASNVGRLRIVGQIAARTGRRLCLLGRSVETHARIGRELGHLRWPSDAVVPPDVAAKMRREDVLVVAGGTQAERAAALMRLAHGTHPTMRLDEGDTVILSSRVIPGNERAVVDLMSALLRLGVVLHTRITRRDVHASGHAHRDEQRRMIDLTRPRGFVPVHGTLHHLVRHAELARGEGVDRTVVVENGECVLLGPAGLRRGPKIPAGRVAAAGGDDLSEDLLRERATLGRSGVVFVALTVDGRGHLIGAPTVLTRGVLEAEDLPDLVLVERAVSAAVRELQGRRTDADLVHVARNAVRRAVEGEFGRRTNVSVAVRRA